MIDKKFYDTDKLVLSGVMYEDNEAIIFTTPYIEGFGEDKSADKRIIFDILRKEGIWEKRGDTTIIYTSKITQKTIKKLLRKHNKVVRKFYKNSKR